MGLKKELKGASEDLKKNANDVVTFYSNPKKYLAKVHNYVKIAFVLYVLGFLAIIKLVDTGGLDTILIRMIYIVTGYFTLTFLYSRYQ